MKIAWYHSHFLHHNSGGSRFVIDYASGLQDKFMHQVTVFCDCASEESRIEFEKLGVGLVELGKHSTNSPMYWLFLPFYIFKSRHKLRNVASNFDILIAGIFPTNIWSSKVNIEKVWLCYEPFAFFYDKDYLSSFTKSQRLFFKLLGFFYSRYDIKVAANFKKVITINKTNTKKIKSIYGIDAKVVYAGIDASVYFRANEEDIANFRGKHEGSPLLFHSTDLGGTKGTIPLLHIIKVLLRHFPRLVLLVTIYINKPKATAELMRLIDEMQLSRNIRLLGCLPKAELPMYYSGVDFVCQPSINQPANWPLKEGLLCGTPIIGGIASEEVNHSNGVRIDVLNLQDSVLKLSELFHKNKDDFYIDKDMLVDNYSFDKCLISFNNELLTK